MENIEYFLLGDLNCDMVATRYDNNTRRLMIITDIYGLQSPTRIPPTSATLIDVIYTKERNVYDQLYTYIEEHNIQSVNINRAFALFTQLSPLSLRPRTVGCTPLTAEKSMKFLRSK